MIHFELPKIEKQLKELEDRTMQEGFWNDSKSSSIVLQQIKNLKGKYNKFNHIKSEVDNLFELNDFLLEEQDDEMANDLLRNTNTIQKELEAFEIETLLSGKFDRNNAIITLHPGAGGTESQDWAEMLYRISRIPFTFFCMNFIRLIGNMVFIP